ncbi:MAG: ABC transporter ATP-binding protein [Bdellovibrionaceae bacterium]|nr:ABC transporter ATP-binding protein [Pseudobdellovibrionaceae bacterium]
MGLTLLLITNALDSSTPLVLKMAIDTISAGRFESAEMLKIAGLFFLLMLVLASSRYGWRVFWSHYHTSAADELRNKIFHHYSMMGPRFFTKTPVGNMMSLIVNDVQFFRNGIGPGLLIIIDGVSLILMIIPAMLYLSPSWTWKCLIFIALTPFFIHAITKKIGSLSKEQQELLARLTSFTQELVSGVKIIKIFSMEKQRSQKYQEISEDFLKKSNHLNRVDSLFGPLMQVAVASGTVLLLYVGGGEVIAGAATLGSFVAFQRYINKIIWPFSALGYGLSQIQKGKSAFERIRAVLQQPKEFPELYATRTDSDLREVESIEFKNVGFKYGEIEVLKHISFEMKKGEFIGVMGPVGSGKSTLLHLIANYLGHYSGQIYINGKDYAQFPKSEIWNVVKIVPQEPFLFSASVKDNVVLSTPMEANDLEQIIALIDFDRDLSALKYGIETPVGEKGVQLSGGQKQRLTLARGVFAKPGAILLDDTLSALDTRTEANVREHLFKSNANQIRVIVANKVQSLMNADRIIVLNEGEIEAIGTHQQLLVKSKFYSRQWQLQRMVEVQSDSV